jgi:hypothetical protein
MSPRYTYDTKADYDAISYRRVPGQDRLAGPNAAFYHYHRNHEYPWHERVADWLISTSGFDLARVAIIGSGFPFTQQALHAHPSLTVPLGTVASQDTSPYIQASSSETPEHRAEIQRVGLDPDAGEGAALLTQMDGGPRLSFTVADGPISGGGGRAAVRNLCGGRPTFCYSEMVVESLFEAEILALTDDMKVIGNAGTTYAHMVVTRRRNHLAFDIRPLAEWRAYFDANGHSDVVLIDATSFEVG